MLSSFRFNRRECFLFVYFHYDRDDVPAGQQKIILVDISAQDISADRLLQQSAWRTWPDGKSGRDWLAFRSGVASISGLASYRPFWGNLRTLTLVIWTMVVVVDIALFRRPSVITYQTNLWWILDVNPPIDIHRNIRCEDHHPLIFTQVHTTECSAGQQKIIH